MSHLLSKGETVAVIPHGVQSAAMAQALREAGLVPVLLGRADLAEPQGLAARLAGVAGVVLTSPIDHRPGAREALVDRVLEASARAGVRRLVLNTAGPAFDDHDHPVSRVLVDLRQRVLAGPVLATVLHPTVYLDNLLGPWTLPGIVNDGVFAYPTPADVPVPWLSHRDLGRLAAAALTSDAAQGQALRVGGSPALSAAGLAEALSRQLARPVGFVRIAPADFAAGLNAALGAPAGDDIAALYRWLDERPDAFAPFTQAGRLGIVPETPAQFLARQDWAGLGASMAKVPE